MLFAISYQYQFGLQKQKHYIYLSSAARGSFINTGDVSLLVHISFSKNGIAHLNTDQTEFTSRVSNMEITVIW
jgi:hypothetical protein